MPERTAIRAAYAVVLALLLGGAAWIIVHFATEPGRQRAAARAAQARAVQADARASAATDAIGVVTATQAAEAAAARQTEENTRAITSAPGAAAPVDPALRRVALERLCGRAAYRAEPRCRQLQHAPP